MMKKFMVAIAVGTVLVLGMGLTGCNRQIIDTTYSFDHAILKLPDGRVIDGNVQSWRDYEGDSIQVKIDGTTYLVHLSDAVLITY